LRCDKTLSPQGIDQRLLRVCRATREQLPDGFPAQKLFLT
jgi:hypothetical protein